MMNMLYTLAQEGLLANPSSSVHQTALTPIGWLIMILAIGGMTALLGWCVYKVVTVSHPEEHLHTQSDITPPDEIEEKE